MCFELVQKLIPPESEGSSIMATNIFDILNNQSAIGLVTNVIQKLGNGRQIASWEDVMVDKANKRERTSQYQQDSVAV